jgi:hypothetical protein
MTMVLFSADGAANQQSFQRLCICHPCVYGFGIPLEVDGATFRFCGELCVVGRPVFVVDGDPAEEAVVAAKAATLSLAPAHLRCSICNIEVDHSSSVDDTAFSLDN